MLGLIALGGLVLTVLLLSVLVVTVLVLVLLVTIGSAALTLIGVNSTIDTANNHEENNNVPMDDIDDAHEDHQTSNQNLQPLRAPSP